MKNILGYHEFNIREGRKSDVYNMGGDLKSKLLYHFTQIEHLWGILDANFMLSGDAGDFDKDIIAISCTTDPNLLDHGVVFTFGLGSKHSENLQVRITLDFLKLKKDGYKAICGSEELGTYRNEREIKIISDKIDNISAYIIEVQIDYSKFSKDPKKNKWDIRYFDDCCEFMDKHNIPYTVINKND